MPYAPPKPIDLAFPLKGVDRSLPARQQPAMTTYDLLNVRAFAPASDRLGGGTREGTTKLFAGQAGTDLARKINGLTVLTEASGIVDPSAFSKVALVEDFSTQSVGNRPDMGVNWDMLELNSTRNYIRATTRYSVSADPLLKLYEGFAGFDSGLIMAACSHFVDQATGIIVVIQGSQQSSTSTGTPGQPTFVGPFLAANNDCKSYVDACIVGSGTNKIKCSIREITNGIPSTKAESAEITLTGAATDTDYTITMTNTAGVISARFQATGVVSGPANLDETVTWTTAFSGQRGGVTTTNTGGTDSNSRFIKSIALTKLIPPARTVYGFANASAPNPTDGNGYYLNGSFRGASRSSGGVLTITDPAPTSASNPDWLSIDDGNDRITVTNPDTRGSTYGSALNWCVFDGDVGEQLGISFSLDSITFTTVSGLPCPVFRVSSDYRSGLFLHFYLYKSLGNMITISDPTSSMRGFALIDNVVTTLGPAQASTPIDGVTFHINAEITITDDGTNIRIYVNGMLRSSFTPESIFSGTGWTTEIGAALANNHGVGFTDGIDTGLTTHTTTFGSVKIVEGEVVPEVSFDTVKNKLAIFSREKVQIGDGDALTITDVSGPVLANPLPMAASFNRKFYAVDGANEIIVDTGTNLSSSWSGAVTAGVLPAGCALVANFRGSTYLAATAIDPTIWYKSRSLDPLDWDYGADPQVSSAVAGNNGEVGQPADAITALIPYSSDYLVFGMARSLGVLEGDPGYGGQFQIVSNEAGIVGPRAHCFDDRGNLYFMGAGGLYRMFRGQFDPEPVGPRKLRRTLEEIDTSANLIQMAFRPTDRTVRIFITPADGTTIGTHVVYDTRTDGFFLDQYPINHGPWAVAQTTGVTETDRNMVLGGNDGYIRRPDDSAVNDDGAAIRSFVDIPVPEEFLGLSESMCQELQFVLGEGGQAIQWAWFTGASPEQVRLLSFEDEQYEETGVVQGTGFMDPIGIRATGASHRIRLDATSSLRRWSMERLVAVMATTNIRRR